MKKLILFTLIITNIPYYLNEHLRRLTAHYPRHISKVTSRNQRILKKEYRNVNHLIPFVFQKSFSTSKV